MFYNFKLLMSIYILNILPSMPMRICMPKITIIPMPSASWFSFIPRIRIINQYSKPFRVLRWKKVKANSSPSLK